MRKILKVCFAVLWSILLLAVLLCPNYIANPVVTILTLRAWVENYDSTHMLISYRPYWYGAIRNVLSYPAEPVLIIYSTVALLAILGSCAYCRIRKMRKTHISNSIAAPKARWKKKLAFGLLLLMIALARPNPVMSTLLAPLANLKLPVNKIHLFGWSPLSLMSSAQMHRYTLLTGQYFTLNVTYDNGRLSGTLNYPYLIHMILIAAFVAVTRLGVIARDRWLHRAQPSQPGNPAQEEP